MAHQPIVQYDKNLPEIPGRLPWERPEFHLVKTVSAKDGWAIAPGRRDSILLLIEKLREAVDAWRDTGYHGVSAVTRRLLEYWFEEDQQVAGFSVPFRFHFGQREAIETLVYVVEVLGHRDCKETIRNFGSVYGEDLFRKTGIEFQTLPDGTRQVSRYVAEVDREQVQDLPVDYPLAQAVEDRIVKAPLIVRHVSGTKVPPHDPTGITKDNVCDKYGYWIHAAVERWKVHTKAYKATGLKPVLFIMAEKTGYADVIGKHLVDAHNFKEHEVLVIHTDTTGEITKADLDKARIAANEIDKPANKIRAIVSVMILKEGWDVRNVSVVLGLRPFGTAILPQQVIGRGLRLMDRTLLGPDRTQTLEVLGTKNLLDTLKANLEAEGVGVGDTGDPPLMPVTITPLKERAKFDIAIPLTKPCLFHNVQKLAGLDVMSMESILNEDGLDEGFKIKLQADFATVEVFVGAPEISLQSKPLHETLAYLTNRICEMAKLGGKFAELYPLVATYVEYRCFGRVVEIDPETDEGKKVAEHLTRQDIRESVARRLAHKIAKLLVERRELAFDNQDFTLGDTKAFTWRRNLSAGPLVCTKTVFNYVATYNDFERRFAQFLDKKNSGILRFAALGTTEQGESNTSFRVDYLKPTGAIGFYYPDWVAVEKTETGETNWIIETKGRVFDKEQIKAKDDAIKDWCHRVSESTGEQWDYIRIDQKTFDGRNFVKFANLVCSVSPALLI